MAVGLNPPDSIAPVDGIRLAACHSGIKQDPAVSDLVLIEIAESATTAAVFTSNRFCAAPVVVARQHLETKSDARYLLINSGNANAGTGEPGYDATMQTCQTLAGLCGTDPQQVLPFSTGVIGQLLPAEKINAALPGLTAGLAADQWLAAAHGIMTTDTVAKAISRRVNINNKSVTISGIAKGSGMIRPDMATMLAFIATDAEIAQPLLSRVLQQAVAGSFNSITVDGDTSTNDACVLIATGASGVPVAESDAEFIAALQEVFNFLAQAIVRDGEGATKFVEVRVEQAANLEDARAMAYTIAHSPLVKTALFASDANWGRILAAIGRAPVLDLLIERVDLYLGATRLIHQGLPDPAYTEVKGQAEMERDEIQIRVDLNSGHYASTVWTTDLSYDYVKINAEYRS